MHPYISTIADVTGTIDVFLKGNHIGSVRPTSKGFCLACWNLSACHPSLADAVQHLVFLQSEKTSIVVAIEQARASERRKLAAIGL